MMNKFSFPTKIKQFFCISSLLILSACFDKSATNTTPPISSLKINLTPVFSEFTFSTPLAMYQSKTSQWFVVEQNGLVKTFTNNDKSTKIFIDIREKVNFDGEMGLLGMALHPDFEQNGIFFLSYTGHDDVSYISKFNSQNHVADPSTELVILSVQQPYSNHNGGQISFGPDGYLYIGFGDGGWFGDPKNHGQNIDSLLGTLLRIDVNSASNYTIPKDNPFVNRQGKDEIYAYGFRNPWRWSFDKLNGDLWLADVGQNGYEEINKIQKAGNYGWNVLEANHCYAENNCDPSLFVAPIHEYPRSEGQSVTGGYVYRGSEINNLYGTYIFADYVTGKIWGLEMDENNKYKSQLFIDSDLYISSFAEDQTGNLYVIGHQSGKIYKITGK